MGGYGWGCVALIIQASPNPTSNVRLSLSKKKDCHL